MSFNHYSLRAAFTGMATCLATVFGAAMAVYQLRGQSDLIIDVIKIAGVLAVGTACVSFAVWSLIHRKESSLIRGALAGLITGFFVVPLPNFASALKAAFLESLTLGEAEYFTAILDAVLPAMKTGLQTFQVLTKVSLVAIIACLCLGIIVVWCVPSEPDEM